MMRRTLSMAVTATMSSLAIVASALRLELPFPVLTFLKFDFAELFSVLTFALAGPWWSYFCALMHMVGLLVRGSDPLGASMKFAAVVSMLAGLQAARRRWKAAVASAIALRVAAMCLANFLVLCYFFPSWLAYSEKLLKAAGFNVQGEKDALILTMVFVALFNALHVPISVLPSVILAEKVKKTLKL